MERIRHLVNAALRRLPEPLALIVQWPVRQLRLLLLGPYVHALVVRTADGLLLVEPSDPAVAGTLRLTGAWQPACLEAVRSVTRSDSAVLIVGAHIGSVLLPLARVARHVVGLEPNPDTFELLQLNIRLNGLQNTEVFNYAAGDRDDTVAFLAHVQSGSSHLGDNVPHSLVDAPRQVRVPMRRLDDQFPDRVFDVVVMDIEGSEPQALAGMEFILSHAQALLIEVFPRRLQQVSGSSADALAKQLSPHFSHARQVDDHQWFSIEQLGTVLRDIFRRDGNTDLLLVKAPPVADGHSGPRA